MNEPPTRGTPSRRRGRGWPKNQLVWVNSFINESNPSGAVSDGVTTASVAISAPAPETPILITHRDHGTAEEIGAESSPKTTRTYVTWPKLAVSLLVEIMAVTYNFLLNKTDTALKQLVWKHSLRLLKVKLVLHKTLPEHDVFQQKVTSNMMQKKWADLKAKFIRAFDLARSPGFTGTVQPFPFIKEIAKITRDDPGVQPEVTYESINREETGPSAYRRDDVMTLIGSDNEDKPTFGCFLTRDEIRRLVIDRARDERYPGSTEGSSTNLKTKAVVQNDYQETENYTGNYFINNIDTVSLAKIVVPPTRSEPSPGSTQVLSPGPALLSTNAIEAIQQISNECLATMQQIKQEIFEALGSMETQEKARRIEDKEEMRLANQRLFQRLDESRAVALEELSSNINKETRERFEVLEQRRIRRKIEIDEMVNKMLYKGNVPDRSTSSSYNSNV